MIIGQLKMCTGHMKTVTQECVDAYLPLVFVV